MERTESGMLERKVHYLGAWRRQRVDQAVIAEINNELRKSSGSKVKLQLSRDGLRVVKTMMIIGKTLQDFIPMAKIHVMTVSQHMPDLLLVIALSRDQDHRFQIEAFRCASGLDAGVYVQAFRGWQRAMGPITVVRKSGQPAPTSEPGPTSEEINWTLRSKEADNSKRELKKLVDLHGEKAILHKTELNNTAQVPNGHTEVFETGVRIPLYRKGKPSRIESTQSEDSLMDSRSEVSESALRQELDTLSQELRDIKFMLEQSTGVTGSEPPSPRDVTLTRQTVVTQPENIIIRRTEPNDDDDTEVHAVVIDDDEVQMRPKKTSSGYHVSTAGNTTHVRVSVPDYRSSQGDVREERQTITEPGSGVTYTVTKVNNGPAPVPVPAPETRTVTTTSYDSWKRDTLTRNAVVYRDIPERIQWRSRSSAGPRHVVSTRARSAIPNFSDGGLVQVRHQSAGYGPTYHRMSHVHGVPHDRKVHSVRSKGLATTVARPIEKVYMGRTDAKQHSLVVRNPETRPTILVKDGSLRGSVRGSMHGSVRGSQIFMVEQNNNVVKADTNDTNLLDVTGLDLYNSTPHDVTVTEGEVIRT